LASVLQPIPPMNAAAEIVETAAVVLETKTRIYEIFLAKRANVEAGLQALAKRATKKGLSPLVWSWGQAYEVVVQREPPPGVKVSKVMLTLSTEIPKYAGWSFVAALTHLDGENVVRTVAGSELPVLYRTRGPVCDHCKHNRRRSETYVLRHEDNRLVQVGSTCLADFLGSDTAGRLASCATYLADAAGLAEEGESEGGSGSSGDVYLGSFLATAAFCIRVNGWTSRTAARGSFGHLHATADSAWLYSVNSKQAREDKVEPTAEDIALADHAAKWAEELSEEAINAMPGDYLHNLHVVAKSAIVNMKLAGIAASMIIAYERNLGIERKRQARVERAKLSMHVGEIKKRQIWPNVELEFVTGYEGAYGYTTVLKFRTVEGAMIVWKASNTKLARADVGKHYNLAGTVKKHEEYKGEKQTLVSRCSVGEILSEAVGANVSTEEAKS
jgi:hypothetical protein